MNGSITPAFIEEATVFIQRLEKVDIGLTAKPVEISNLEIAPLMHEGRLAMRREQVSERTYEMALVIRVASIVAQEGHRIVRVDMLGMGLDELLGTFPQGGNSLDILI